MLAKKFLTMYGLPPRPFEWSDMDDLVWNDSLSVGDQILDGHHKRLFTLCSELERVIVL